MKTNRICRRAWKQVLLFIAVIVLFTGFSQPVSALNITIIQSEGGTITASPESAKAGDKVTITVTTDLEIGLKDKTLKANDKVLNEKYNPSGIYTFIMPSTNVTVSAEFDDIFLLKTGSELNFMFDLNNDSENGEITKFIYGAKSKYAAQISSWTNKGSACEDDSDKAIMYINRKVAYLLSDDVGLTRANFDSDLLFNNCTALTSVDLTSFDTSMVTNMYRMFNNCYSLTSLNVTSFDTSQVENMSGLFSGCAVTSLDLSNFDTSNVTDMSEMFSYCDKLKNIDLSNFNTSNVTNMSNMFAANVFTSLDVSNFDTSQVTKMNSMFSESSALTKLDLSNFDTSNVKNMTRMFAYCNELTTIYASNTFVTTKESNFRSYAFIDSPKIKAKRYGGRGEVLYDATRLGNEMLKIATATDDGYFTDIRLKP